MEQKDFYKVLAFLISMCIIADFARKLTNNIWASVGVITAFVFWILIKYVRYEEY